jgi:hypothetical protein
VLISLLLFLFQSDWKWIKMPAGGKKDGESSGDETKKRSASPVTDNNDSDSLDGNRRSRRKKTRVCDCRRLITALTETRFLKVAAGFIDTAVIVKTSLQE